MSPVDAAHPSPTIAENLSTLQPGDDAMSNHDEITGATTADALVSELLSVTPEASRLAERGLDKLLDSRRTRALTGGDVKDLDAADPSVKATLQAGTVALQKLRAGTPRESLSAAELDGLAAFVVFARPALLVNGSVFPVVGPPFEGDVDREENTRWLNEQIPSVGRIGGTFGGALQPIGSGFVIAPNIVLTNAHVICLGERHPDLWNTADPATNPSVAKFLASKPTIDFLSEAGSKSTRTHRITKVLRVGASGVPMDLGLLEVAPISEEGTALPVPLKLSSKPAGVGATVCTVGYPVVANDGVRLVPLNVMKAVFGPDVERIPWASGDLWRIPGFKRLSPGKLRAFMDDGRTFDHDCSTLAGNSGSAVFDLARTRVVGLHYTGTGWSGNRAIALWNLRPDVTSYLRDKLGARFS
jgi:hypothetical protein